MQSSGILNLQLKKYLAIEMTIIAYQNINHLTTLIEIQAVQTPHLNNPKQLLTEHNSQLYQQLTEHVDG